jgi:DNA-binding beta-propeller fold protein YncE
MEIHKLKSITKLLYYYFISLLPILIPAVYAQDAEVPVLKTKTLFFIKADFKQPSDVAVANDGKIYVLDGVNNRIKIFNPHGIHLSTFGGAGEGSGKFNFPLGIGIDEQGRVYVADSGNHRIQIFSPDGKYLSGFNVETGRKDAKPSDPTDIAVNSSLNKCYVVDNDNHCLLVYDLINKSLIKARGIMGTEKREYRFPFMIDIDSEGNLYLVEVINTRVKKVDPEGIYLKSIGGWGVEKGEFYRPKGVAVDSKDRVFVSDSYLGIIQVFDKEGTFLYVLGNENGSIIKFKTPTGLSIDKHMRLYVVEMLADRVRVLSLKQ